MSGDLFANPTDYRRRARQLEQTSPDAARTLRQAADDIDRARVFAYLDVLRASGNTAADMDGAGLFVAKQFSLSAEDADGLFRAWVAG